MDKNGSCVQIRTGTDEIGDESFLRKRTKFFGGLKAQNNKVVSMGLPVCTEQCFANVVMSLKGRTSRGGALTSTCNAVGEIFKIAAIMNALTLVGVAVGFVLLRIEASVEEAE